MKISLDLTEPQGRALTEAAQRLHVRPEDLAAAAVRDLVAQSAEFDAAAARVLEKNSELYRRLA
ncbi:MAG: hypothetical protein KA180_15760 [Gemmatimonadales bacterium]|nr:hypothetical protein [Gemmatimonadales bacterium]